MTPSFPMTLRVRLLSALLAVAVIVLAAFGVVFVRQHSVLLDPIDEQLEAVVQSLPRTETFFLGPDQPGDQARSDPPTGELYIAIHEAGTDPQLLASPANDPSFSPEIDVADLASRQSVDEPFTIGTVGDGGARVVGHDLGEGRWAIAALSTRNVEEAQRELLVTAAVVLLALLVALAVVVYLVDRLGIRPILEVTRAAEELASTRSEPRVDVGALSTEAGRLGLSFNKMLDAHQAADAQQRRFVANASHELRTPLTTLQGYTALYANGALVTPEQVDDAMRRIGSEAKRMSRLVEELLTLAALDEGRPIATADVDLVILLQDLASDAAAIQPDRQINTIVEPDLHIRADAEMLTQALTTTIHNALRHTPTSAGLTLRAVRNGSHVRIDVADRGPGIDPADLDHVFDRFYRPHKVGGRSAGGTGLGLAIAKSVAEAHHGTIRVSSSANDGTTVVFTLPLTTENSPSASYAKNEPRWKPTMPKD